MPAWLDALFPAQQQLDLQKPVGVFRLCDTKQHVIEFWYKSCPECERRDALPPEPVEAPDLIAVIPVADPESAQVQEFEPFKTQQEVRTPNFHGGSPPSESKIPSLEHLAQPRGSRTEVFLAPASTNQIPGGSPTIKTTLKIKKRTARPIWGQLQITVDLSSDCYQLDLSDGLTISSFPLEHVEITSQRSALMMQDGGQALLRTHPRAHARVLNRDNALRPDGLHLKDGDQVQMEGVVLSIKLRHPEAGT